MGTKVAKCNVVICEDHVARDAKEVEQILNRVSKIIASSYRRRIKEGEIS